MRVKGTLTNNTMSTILYGITLILSFRADNTGHEFGQPLRVQKVHIF